MDEIKKYALEDRFVAFIDILGFKDIVINNKNPEKIMIALENAKEKIKKYKYRIADDFNLNDIDSEWEQRFDRMDSELKSTPYCDDDLEETLDDDSDDLKITWFSDSLILSTKSDHIYNLYLLICIVKNLQYSLFDNEILLRGAITIGECYHDETNVYGKAMIESYMLESKIVVTPRIIISEKLLDYIITSNSKESKNIDKEFDYLLTTSDYNYAYEISKNYSYIETYQEELLHKILRIDTDGYYFIDYLKPLFILKVDNMEYDKEFFEKSKKFIRKEIRNPDMNISLKYIWLKDYFNKTITSLESQLKEDLGNSYYELIKKL